MVALDDKWKLDPSCRFEVYLLSTGDPYEELQKVIEQRKLEYTDEGHQRVEKKVIDENEFLKEKKAREILLQAVMLYAKGQERFFKWNKIKENYFVTLHETLKTMKNELDIVANKLFAFELNGKMLTKRGGETMEHYLMRGIMLQYLHEKYGVKEFYEEYSKLNEVFERIQKGHKDKEEWKKAAKRADLYVVLNDGSKLWMEVERGTSSRELNKTLRNVKTVSSVSSGLIDKVVFVFPSLICHMTLGTLVESKKVRFPASKLEFYEVNLRDNQITHVEKPSLVKTEFGDGLLDMIGDGLANPTGKIGLATRKKIQERVIVPLFNRTLEQAWIIEKQDKIRKLIRFWRVRTGKFTVSQNEIEFKQNALSKIKKDYPFLLA